MSTPCQAEALLKDMIAFSPYRDYLLPIQADVVRVAFLNHQIRAAILAASAAGGRARRSIFRRKTPDVAVIETFLEYVAFASPGFLASVGEWPLGGGNG